MVLLIAYHFLMLDRDVEPTCTANLVRIIRKGPRVSLLIWDLTRNMLAEDLWKDLNSHHSLQAAPFSSVTARNALTFNV